MEPKIRAFIARNGLAGSVRILGHVSRKQLLTELLDADVVVLPSLREAQPISVLEAMACRKPVVVFDFPFVHEYIQNSFNGLLAKGKDSKDLANTILTLLSDKNLRDKLGENAYRYVQLKHNWENIADNYLNLYEKLIAAN
jgi:N,N'-diacetylbacillosaminyl-diphospho-undecaprenol alpha-1,3-N-acetylgalactosaminyltransferase